MPIAPFEPAKNRLVQRLITAFEEGKLLKKNESSYSPRELASILAEVAGDRESTSWNTLTSWLGRPEVLMEVNQALLSFGSPLRVKRSNTPPPDKIYIKIEGCAYGPLGLIRWPIRPRFRQWLTMERPKLLEWWLQRPSVT